MAWAPEVFITVGREVHGAARFGLALAALSHWREEMEAGRVARVVIQDWGASRAWWQAASEAGLRWDGRIERVALAADGSQRARHEQAARLAGDGPYYVLADSDIILLPGRRIRDHGEGEQAWPEYVAALFTGHQAHDILSALPLPGGLGPPPDYPDRHVWTVHNCGGVRFVRCGALAGKALPPLDPQVGGGYDHTLGQWVLERDRACGYAYRLAALHMGYGDSCVW